MYDFVIGIEDFEMYVIGVVFEVNCVVFGVVEYEVLGVCFVCLYCVWVVELCGVGLCEWGVIGW